MKIDRPTLVEAFSQFELSGNGVVIGAPGVGKSHLLHQHFLHSRQNARPSFLLALDKHVVRNDHELRTALALHDDLISVLNADPRATDASPGLLILDSYDSLRSEASQKYARTLIRRAANVLKTRWRIVVSVRTFDASRSETLLELFSPTEAALPQPFRLAGMNCRHFFVPPLSDEEVYEAMAPDSELKWLHGSASRGLLELLRIPFNVWLAEKLLASGLSPSVLSTISSEVQLLSLFWRRRVAEGPLALRRQHVLTLMTRQMVEARQLSIRKEGVYRPEDDDVWSDLLSAGVITTTDSTGQRVALSHNTIFDFAVSVLLIEDDAGQVAKFLAVEPARPVFLRPSITYYFTRLWFETRQTFWTVTWALLTSSDPHLRLYGRLLPMGVIVKEARTLDDFAPLVDALSRAVPAAPDAVLRLLQARRALQQLSELWLGVLELLTAHLHKTFAWDVAVHTYELLTPDTSWQGRQTAGRIGRTILAMVWANRTREQWAEALGQSWATRLVVSTYCTDPAASRALLTPIIDAIEGGTLPIEYLRRVSHGVSSIWPCDPALVARLYEATFVHKETSTEATNMGTPVFPMTSNRRQDFEMSVYELAEQFTEFLQAMPTEAISAGVSAVDRYVQKEHVERFLKTGFTVDDVTYHFGFLGHDVIYI